MSIGPMHVGDTAPAALFTCQTPTGVVDLTGLSGSAFTLIILDAETGVQRTGSGSFTVQSPTTAGVVLYTWNAADTSIPGNYNLYLRIQTSGGQETSDPPYPWVVKEP